ncbi:hypothetical protein [Chthonobacter albigriseus]|uniref:hypothetical protein n=1 Tax=Chthonobacter albigriseus TaxID=1683161 RepID=UPI0015EEB924|nr:hypothetical protein [Chthonobacter albigriseus]
MVDQTASQPYRPSRTYRLIATSLVRARGALAHAAAFGLVHATLVTLITIHGIGARDMAFGSRSMELISTFALGSALGGFAAWIVAAVVVAARPVTARFAGMLLALSVGTAGGIATIYFVAFTSYFQNVHEGMSLLQYVVGFVFATASVAYTFAASGAPLLMPWGVVPLIGGAAAFAHLAGSRSG